MIKFKKICVRDNQTRITYLCYKINFYFFFLFNMKQLKLLNYESRTTFTFLQQPLLILQLLLPILQLLLPILHLNMYM